MCGCRLGVLDASADGFQNQFDSSCNQVGCYRRTENSLTFRILTINEFTYREIETQVHPIEDSTVPLCLDGSPCRGSLCWGTVWNTEHVAERSQLMRRQRSS